MIQKKEAPYITKLRIVQLYEADYNAVLKFLLGKRMLNHAKDNGIVNDQLYARKGKSTYDALITSRVTYDLARIQQDNLISIFNNLKGNYDRVRPSLNTITTRWLGLPPGAAICHAKVLRNMKHYIRTSYGISEGHIIWDKINNIGGLGQGNGAGPASWHSHMLVLVYIYEQMTSHRVRFTDPNCVEHFSQWLVGYVDDNTILATIPSDIFQPNKAPDLITMAKECIEIWQRIIHITGGELEIEKSCISIISWKEAKGNEVMCKIEDSQGELHIESIKSPGVLVPIKRNEPHHAERILGVRLALDGNDKTEFEYRLQQSKDLARKISSAPFTRQDAELIYSQRWISSVGYCLPITQFTEQQCLKIQIPFYRSILSRMGFN